MEESVRLVRELEMCLSKPRITRYRPSSATTDPNFDTLVNYFWNIALADALYCSLNAVEIVLRNSIHLALSDRLGTPEWYDTLRMLEPYQQAELENAKRKIAASGSPVTPDRVVAGLTLGFWVTILSSPYDSRFWQAKNARTLRTAFPNVRSVDRQRSRIHRRYNEIRVLRNRVSHHEPLFDDPRLGRRHRDVMWAIHWINPTMRTIVERLDRFPTVYRSGRSLVEADLRLHLER